MSHSLASDWDLLHDTAKPESPVDAARIANERGAAAQRVADFAGTLPRITVRLTEHFDWDRLRVNVAHRVSPGLVRWR